MKDPSKIVNFFRSGRASGRLGAMANDRGQYGTYLPTGVHVGAEPSARSLVPWIVGGAALLAGAAIFGGYAASTRPHLSAHEKEVRAWEREFPGLPWYMDQVKNAQQLDTWERARNYWERTH